MAEMDLNKIYSTRGKTIEVMPIPPIPENCHEISAGPLRFVLESRLLNEEIARQHGATRGMMEDDAGASLHVFGASDGLEHLRFDCFEKMPHYHYVRQGEQRNQIVQIDDVAVDPIDWTLLCLRRRLGDMLEYAGAKELAAEVRSDSQTVNKAIDLVSRKIVELSRASR